MKPHQLDQKIPVVIRDILQEVQLSVVAAITDLRSMETVHPHLLDSRQRKLVHGWYRQLDDVGREISEILGRE